MTESVPESVPASVHAGLSLEAVTHAYGGTVVVKGVSLAVAPGEVLCLLGPSGCGKTTLLRIVAGLEIPMSGRVRLGGRVVSGEGAHLPPEKRHVGFLFQDFALFPHLDVLDNVAFGLDRLPRRKRRDKALAMLERVGMAEHASAWPHTLSGGQQQRVALARALAPDPRVMLLDEPFSGLDSRLRDRVRDQTLHLLKESGVSTLMVTHDPEEAMFMGDRIALMRDGRVVQVGRPETLYAHPVDAFTASFFGEVNRLETVARHGRAATPFGPLEAPEGAEGRRVEVLIRPEALRLAPVGGKEDGRAVVIAARLLGRSSLIHLRAQGPDGPCDLHARIPGCVLPSEGTEVSVLLDRAQVFVYTL